MQLYHAVLLLSTFFIVVRSSPLVLDNDNEQAPLAVPNPADGPVYKDGELPPLRDTAGWIDPRLNGGRFLDVSMRYRYTSRRLTD